MEFKIVWVYFPGTMCMFEEGCVKDYVLEIQVVKTPKSLGKVPYCTPMMRPRLFIYRR